MTPERRGWLAVGLAVATAVVLWDAAVLWPVKVFLVVVHELGHALAAIATGGSVVEIRLTASQGGQTDTVGGSALAILNAGYLASWFVGLGLLVTARSAMASRLAALACSVVLLVATELWTTGLASLVTLISASATLAVAFSGAGTRRWVLRGFGVFCLVYAVVDLRADLVGGSPTDARMLAEQFGGPPWLWAGTWAAVGVLGLGLAAGISRALRARRRGSR